MPNEGYQFVRWIDTPCNSTTSTTCTFTINRSLSIRALFEPIPIPGSQALLQPDQLQYIGAFKVPLESVNGSSFNMAAPLPFTIQLIILCSWLGMHIIR